LSVDGKVSDAKTQILQQYISIFSFWRKLIGPQLIAREHMKGLNQPNCGRRDHRRASAEKSGSRQMHDC
jgi:hypothetical protein